jgi:hypothetical protein
MNYKKMGITICMCPKNASIDNTIQIPSSTNQLSKPTQNNNELTASVENPSSTTPSPMQKDSNDNNNNNNKTVNTFAEACLEGIVVIKHKSKKELVASS